MKRLKFFLIIFLCIGVVSLVAQNPPENTQTQETEKTDKTDKANQADNPKVDNTDRTDSTEKKETEPDTSNQPEEENTAPIYVPDDSAEKGLEDEMQTGDFVYNPAGRRDPFWNPLQGKNINLKREEKEGIAGLLIDELDLEGIIFKEGKYIALFKGPDGIPYDVKVGDNVYDGEVIKIEFNSVVFKRILTIALGGTKEKLIIKSLTPEEEAAKQ